MQISNDRSLVFREGKYQYEKTIKSSYNIKLLFSVHKEKCIIKCITIIDKEKIYITKFRHVCVTFFYQLMKFVRILLCIYAF